MIRQSCAVCGHAAPAKQHWYNRDTGYGICGDCAARLQPTTDPDEFHDCYGDEGVHWFPVNAVDRRHQAKVTVLGIIDDFAPIPMSMIQSLLAARMVLCPGEAAHYAAVALDDLTAPPVPTLRRVDHPPVEPLYVRAVDPAHADALADALDSVLQIWDDLYAAQADDLEETVWTAARNTLNAARGIVTIYDDPCEGEAPAQPSTQE